MANPFRQPVLLASSKETILYDDLQSARSAILSGSARNRHGVAKGLASSSPRGSPDVAFENNAIPLKEMKPSNDLPRPSMRKASDNLPRPSLRNTSDGLPHSSLLRKVSNHRRVKIDTDAVQNQSASKGDGGYMNEGASKSLASGSVFQNIRATLAPSFSPTSRQAESLGLDDGAYIKQDLDLEAGGSMDTSSEQYSIPNLHEGHSTVGNIYKLYARSGREEVEVERRKSPAGPVTEKLMAPSTCPPIFPLPSLSGSGEVLSCDARTPLHESSAIFSDAGLSTVNSLPTFSPRNPFRASSRSSGRNRNRSGGQDNRRSAVMSFADDSHCIYDNQAETEAAYERLPLERQVSNALRRASGFSFYSIGSASDGPSLPLPSRPQKQKGILAVDSSMHGPISYNGYYPDSPPYSPANHLVTRRSDLQDAFFVSPSGGDTIEKADSRHATPDDDWETVGDSAFGLDARQSREFIPAMFGTYGHYGDNSIQRAGSSIANTSDAGSLSMTVPEVDYINSSTDRITQHPARIEYSNDYRLRELKNTHMPVLLPSYNDHKVNGYLANSSRVIPQSSQWFRTDPKPMKNPHRHPFNTTPPEVAASLHPRMPKGDKKKANHFPRLSKVMREENLQAFSSAECGPSSWAYLMAHADGSILPGSRDNSKNSGDIATKQAAIPGGEGAQTDESAATSGQERSLHQRLDRRPMVQGPPGAFYQGLRSDGKSRKVRGPHQDTTPNRMPSRHGIRDYPTNELRPLSLSLRYDPTGVSRSLSQTSDRNVYRSTLSPPERQTWRDLYTRSQLEEIDQATEQSAFDRRRTEQWLNTSIKTSTMDDMVPRTFFSAPTLHPPARVSMRVSLRTTKDSVSVAVLFFCAFFPPLLGFYLLGYLNGIMKWATGGECSSYTDRGRKVAKALLLCWMFAAIVGVIVFICWWTTIRKRH